MPSLLWQLHHSDDGSDLKLEQEQPQQREEQNELNSSPTGSTSGLITCRADIPGLRTALEAFKSKHPSFASTSAVDETRESDYPHLGASHRACFDYCGFGLFTYTQRFTHGHSRSAFALAPSPAVSSLQSHAAFASTEPGTLQSELRARVLEHLNLADGAYSLIFTASKRAAFSLLAACYDFRSRPRLLSVYDHRSESLETLTGAARRGGAKICAARFRWPGLQICGEELAALLKSKGYRRGGGGGSGGKGLFVFPTQSRITGVKYSYQWMTMAERHRWDVLLDVSAMGPRDMGSLGLSMFRPDFIVCSFYKVFGADPTGFGCLLIKNSSMRSVGAAGESLPGLVRVIPDPEADLESEDPKISADEPPVIAFSGSVLDLPDLLVSESEAAEFRDSDDDLDRNGECEIQEERSSRTSSSGGEPSTSNGDFHTDVDESALRRIGRDEGLIDSRQQSDVLRRILPIKEDEEYDPDELYQVSNELGASSSSISRPNPYYEENQSVNDEESWGDYDEDSDDDQQQQQLQDTHQRRQQPMIVCRGLDHASSMGLNRTNCRIKSLMDWFIGSMSILYHEAPPPSSNPQEMKRWRRRPLVRIFGPKVQSDRGPAVAFNLYDQRGGLIQPSLVQKLADRNSIALGCGCLSNLYLDESGGTSGSDKENSTAAAAGKSSARAAKQRKKLLPEKCSSFGVGSSSSGDQGGMKRLSNLWVLTATLGLVSNFEDVYRLWAFAAEFLDAEYVVSEVLQYQALNQETVVLGEQQQGLE